MGRLRRGGDFDFLFDMEPSESLEEEESIGEEDVSTVEGEEGGTQFKTEAWEARLEATHHAVLGFEGAAGLQISNRKFSLKTIGRICFSILTVRKYLKLEFRFQVSSIS